MRTIALLAMLCHCTSAFSQSAHDRISEFLTERESFRKDVTFFAGYTGVYDIPKVRNSDGSQTLDGTITTIQEKLYRMIIKGSEERVDGRLNLGVKGGQMNVSYESTLQTNSHLFHFFSDGPREVASYDRRRPVPTGKFHTFAKDPFQLSTSMFYSARSPTPGSIFLDNIRVLDEYITKDGDYQVVALSSNQRAAWEIVFEREPRWAPKEIKFYQRTTSPAANENLSIQDIRKWDFYATTATKWKYDLRTERWLPKSVNYEVMYGQSTGIGEFYFGGWEFHTGRQEMLDEKKFTVESIQKDFSPNKAEEIINLVRDGS